jgi:hypothetical protein
MPMFDPRVHKYWSPMGPWPADRPVFPTQPGQPTFGPGVPQQGMPQQMRPSFPPQGMPQGMPFGGPQMPPQARPMPQGMPFGGPQMPQLPNGMPFPGVGPQMPVQPPGLDQVPEQMGTSRLRSVLGF